MDIRSRTYGYTFQNVRIYVPACTDPLTKKAIRMAHGIRFGIMGNLLICRIDRDSRFQVEDRKVITPQSHRMTAGPDGRVSSKALNNGRVSWRPTAAVRRAQDEYTRRDPSNLELCQPLVTGNRLEADLHR